MSITTRHCPIEPPLIIRDANLATVSCVLNAGTETNRHVRLVRILVFCVGSRMARLSCDVTINFSKKCCTRKDVRIRVEERNGKWQHLQCSIQHFYYVVIAILFLLMTARDYQHKRFRSPGSKQGSPQNLSLIHISEPTRPY